MVGTLLAIGLAINIFLLVLMLAASKIETFQFWPPPGNQTWQYHSLWWSIRLLVVCVCGLIVLDHSTLSIPAWLRFYVAAPVFLFTFFLGTVAAVQLGWKNTHGIAEEFVAAGLYRFSRNPQYVCYSTSFLMLGIWAASANALILLLTLSLWYLRAPISEESWLEKQYGDVYKAYKAKVPRYLGFGGNK